MADADPSSFAASDACRTHHLYLRCRVDFESRSLRGTAALTVRSERDNLSSLVLDTKDLTIQKVVVNNQVAQFVLGPQHSFKGAPLEITLPFPLRKGQDVVVEVSFETSPRSSALQWFTPEQTSGKRHPFLFSQCQATHCRALLPCQDTPSVKLTYYAEVSTRLLSSVRVLWRAKDLINNLGSTNEVTNLIPNLKELNPDVAYSSVPYEKGFALLLHLEQLLGGPDVFIGFLRAYIQQFAYKSIVTEDWKNFLYSYFKDKVNVLNKVDWNAWMHTPGMPPVKPEYDTTLSNTCVALSQRWIKAGDRSLSNVNTDTDIKNRNSHFIIEVMTKNPLPVSHVSRMQEIYDFNATNNSEIRFRWLRLCIQAKWEAAIPLALKMATEQGRMKFTRPLFKDLYKFEKSRDQAISAFQLHKISMHPVTAMLVSKDLGLEGQTA
ncbi:PREDICTED: leukotriene A-4 hydrolase [Thamnophis sirtalis]|uniref:Leukotriene A-4 hydrolase n=1 Tax=Thamnophis sirtalis TaxID=35019 RepID=A0A6I9WXW8_9SAUR|nr:PREDICTED: leukotriene A-4 hydrolase [Thamnophis sirtalis]